MSKGKPKTTFEILFILQGLNCMLASPRILLLQWWLMLTLTFLELLLNCSEVHTMAVCTLAPSLLPQWDSCSS